MYAPRSWRPQVGRRREASNPDASLGSSDHGGNSRPPWEFSAGCRHAAGRFAAPVGAGGKQARMPVTDSGLRERPAGTPLFTHPMTAFFGKLADICPASLIMRNQTKRCLRVRCRRWQANKCLGT